jgi:hypothetical protein
MAVDEYIELPGTTGLEFDIVDAAAVEGIPHTKGFGSVASSTAVMNEHLQVGLRGASLLVAAW